MYPALEEGGGQRKGKGNRMDELMAVNVSICCTSSEAIPGVCVCVCVNEDGWVIFILL